MDRRAFLAALGAASLLPLPARAATVQAVLDDDEGWLPVADHSSGVTIYEKEVPSLDLTALKGVYALDVDSEKLFELLCDIEGHAQVTGSLLESRIIRQSGEIADYYQVMKSPSALISQRYWVNRSITHRNFTGLPGHHKRQWDALDVTLYPKVRAALEESYPDAVLVTVTHGSWDVSPTELIYRTVTHPSGNVPSSLFSTLSSKTLPDNMLAFVNHLKT